MLATLAPKLLCPVCPGPGRPLALHTFAGDPDGHVRHGVLTCPACASWFPIEDGLLELVVADLLDAGDLGRFAARFARELAALGLSARAAAPGAEEAYAAELKQRHHFDWYAENADQDYTRYQRSPFWVAADELTFARWRREVRPGSWLLDVGCANGRSAFPFAGTGATVVGFDISK